MESDNLFYGELFSDNNEKREYKESDFPFLPLSVLDTRLKNWKDRRAWWRSMGIEGGGSRENARTMLNSMNEFLKEVNPNKAGNRTSAISVFDPVLCELMYRWFCPKEGLVVDPFSGDETRGLVAHMMGRKYIGIDIREEQVKSNTSIARRILGKNIPKWITADSRIYLETIKKHADFVFSCPPYHNLEKYSDLEGDLSNMTWREFVDAYRDIIKGVAKVLKVNHYCVFVVGEIRGRDQSYRGFVPLTIKLFMEAGFEYVNEGIYYMPEVSAAMRANECINNGKLAKNHQNILVFRRIFKMSGTNYTKNFYEL